VGRLALHIRQVRDPATVTRELDRNTGCPDATTASDLLNLVSETRRGKGHFTHLPKRSDTLFADNSLARLVYRGPCIDPKGASANGIGVEAPSPAE
jgi:hypothetical protein